MMTKLMNETLTLLFALVLMFGALAVRPAFAQTQFAGPMPPAAAPAAVETEAVARKFFERHAAQDLDGMLTLFKPRAVVEDPSLAIRGPVEEVAPKAWSALFAAAPGHLVRIDSVRVDPTARTAFVDATIAGRSDRAIAGAPAGRRFETRALYVIEIDRGGRIARLSRFAATPVAGL